MTIYNILKISKELGIPVSRIMTAWAVPNIKSSSVTPAPTADLTPAPIEILSASATCRIERAAPIPCSIANNQVVLTHPACDTQESRFYGMCEQKPVVHTCPMQSSPKSSPKSVTKYSKYVTHMLAMMVDSTTGAIDAKMVKHFESSLALPCCKEPSGPWTGSNRQKCEIVLSPNKANSQFLKGGDNAGLSKDNEDIGGIICELLYEAADGSSLCKELPGKMCSEIA